MQGNHLRVIMGNTTEKTVIGEKMRTGKAVARAKITGDLEVDVDIDPVAFQLIDKVIPAVQLSGVQMLRITGEISRVPDSPRSRIIVHVVKADHIHTKLGEAGGDFLRPVLGGEVGPESKINPPKLRPAPGFSKVEMAVGAGADMAPAVNDRRRILPWIIKEQVRSIDNGGCCIVPWQDKGKPVVLGQQRRVVPKTNEQSETQQQPEATLPARPGDSRAYAKSHGSTSPSSVISK